ncbi:MAG: DUF427 domain-containing protein [Cupriavidus sp.]|nr:DUF427 domain-containing protein [Cupriavidus sp.]
MTDKPVRIPGPDHPITITPTAGRVVVKVAGITIADSDAALSLQESNYAPVQYIPRAHVTYCPYKGDCSYFSIPSGGERGRNAVWSYEAPYAAVAAIGAYLAFYPDRVDSIEIIAP